MANVTLPTLTAGSAVAAGDLFISRQGSDTTDKKVTASQIKTYTTTTANQLEVEGAGTAYTLTATAAKVTLGTTSPALVVTAPGTYLIVYEAQIHNTGATYASERDFVVKLRRTNNTAADLANSTKTVKTGIVTTVTGAASYVTGTCIYTTNNSDDAIELWASVSVLPSAGTSEVSTGSIRAIRLQQ